MDNLTTIAVFVLIVVCIILAGVLLGYQETGLSLAERRKLRRLRTHPDVAYATAPIRDDESEVSA